MARSVRDGRLSGNGEDGGAWDGRYWEARARESGTTFYGAEVFAPDGIALMRVVNGVHTHLAHLPEPNSGDGLIECIGSTIRGATSGQQVQVTDTAIPGPGNWRVTFGTETGFTNLDAVGLNASGIGHQTSYAVGGGTLNASGIGHQRSYGIGGGTVTAPTLEAAGIGHQRSYAVGTGTLNASGQGHQASYSVGGASLNAAGIGHQVSYGSWSMDTPWFPGPTRVIIEDSRTSLTIEDSRTSLTIE